MYLVVKIRGQGQAPNICYAHQTYRGHSHPSLDWSMRREGKDQVLTCGRCSCPVHVMASGLIAPSGPWNLDAGL